jgi:hypothetical protein
MLHTAIVKSFGSSAARYGQCQVVRLILARAVPAGSIRQSSVFLSFSDIFLVCQMVELSQWAGSSSVMLRIAEVPNIVCSLLVSIC